MQELETQYADLYEHSPVMLASIDADTGKILRCNQTLADVLRMPKADIVGESMLTLLSDPSREDAKRTVLPPLAQTGEVVDVELQFQCADGSVRDVLLSTTPVRDESNRVVYGRGVFRDVTALKATQRALAASEAQLRAIFESEPQCVKLVGPDGRLIDMNPAGLAMVEADSIDDVRGQSVYPMVGDEHLAAFQAMHKAVLSGSSERLVFQITGLRGTQRWVESHAAPLCANGKPIAQLAVTHDITERRQVERFIELENELLRMVAAGISSNDALHRLIDFIEQQCPDVVASVLLLEGRKLRHYISPSFSDEYNRLIDGIEIGECVGSCGTAAHRGEPVFVNDIATDPLWADYRQLAEQEGLRACWSTPILGPERNVLGTFAIYRRQPGAPSAVHARIIDAATSIASMLLTRDHQQRRIRQSEQHFEAIFEHAAVGVVLVESQSGRVLRINQRGCQILGTSKAQAICSVWSDLVRLQDESTIMAKIRRMTNGEIDAYTIEDRLIRRDGSERWVHLTVSTMSNDPANPNDTDASNDSTFAPGGGASPMRIVIMDDITERKQAALERRQHRDALAHITRLSTMGELVAGIAHEVKQPLHAIANYATAALVSMESSRESRDDVWLERIKDCTVGIHDAAQRANEIIRRLRDFARRGEQERAANDINDVIRESIDLVAFKARNANVHVEIDLASDLPLAIVDRIQCEQVIVNLLNNAYEALAETDQQKQVCVRTRFVNDHIEIEISDNGPGIPEHLARQVFEAFHTTKSQGLGMGLAISRTIVEDHGGRLEHVVNPQGGARFVISLYEYVPPRHDTHSRLPWITTIGPS